MVSGSFMALYVFGIFLVYTGFKMFNSNQDEEFNPADSKVYRFLKRYLPISMSDGNGRYFVRYRGRPVYLSLIHI